MKNNNVNSKVIILFNCLICNCFLISTYVSFYVNPFEKVILSFSIYRSARQIKRAILENEFLGNLEENQVEALVSAMYPKQIPANTLVIREGDIGTSTHKLYILLYKLKLVIY